MRIVLDTNVLISTLVGGKSGKPRDLIFRIMEGKVQVALSKEILEEFMEVTMIYRRKGQTQVEKGKMPPPSTFLLLKRQQFQVIR
jgi:putative PIN family toxin of toxin-antitoxin system